MRRRKNCHRALAFVATIATMLVPTWGVDTSLAEPASQPATVGQDGRPAAEQTSVIEYGPYNLPPAPTNPDGSHGHYHTGNQFALGIEKPCSDCYITGMQADLLDASGNRTGPSEGLMLHHMVLFNQFDGRTDNTCGGSFLGFLGQRFFASGDERTPIVAQPGYGYYVGNGTWNLIYELMTMSLDPETVSIEMTYDWIPASEAGDITDLEPVWFDVDQCGDSQVSVPAGPSSLSWTWNANLTGDIIGIGGHIHRGGVNVETVNETTGELVCDSVAGYGEDPIYDHHGDLFVSSMSTCGGADEPGFRSPVSAGDQVTITGNYDMPQAVDDQMAIVIAYLAESGQAEECVWWMQWLGLC